ncbi:MAG: glutathione S-transferase family protein [Pseudomonadota bacterium]
MALNTVEETEQSPPQPMEKQPVVLVQFPYVWERNVSPFCLKLESWLRLAEIPFTVRVTMNPGGAPLGKLPYIIDGRQKIADSSAIIAHLKQTRGVDPDAGLSDEDFARSHMLQRLLEEHLYFVLLYSRWIDPDGWSVLRDGFFRSLPAIFRPLVRAMARRSERQLLKKQGLGRLERTEVYERGLADLAAISCLLGDRSFFLGDQLTTIDAIAHGFLANILYVPIESPLKRDAQHFTNLTAWCDAMENGLAAE